MIPVDFIEHLSIGPPIVNNLIEGQDDEEEEIAIRPKPEQSDYGCDTPWLQTIRAYITDGKLPTEKWAARKIRTQAVRNGRQRNLQIEILRTTHDVSGRREGEKSNGRSTFWILRKLFRWKVTSSKNQMPWMWEPKFTPSISV